MPCVYLHGEGDQVIHRYGHVWPNCFPENCPPEEQSDEHDMSIYRLCYDRYVLSSDDFVCDYANPHKAKKYRGRPVDELKLIKAHGISVYDDEETAVYWLQSLHMRRFFKAIAKGNGCNGYSCDEGGHHFIWWSYADVDPLNHFQMVYSTPEEEEGGEDDGIL